MVQWMSFKKRTALSCSVSVIIATCLPFHLLTTSVLIQPVSTPYHGQSPQSPCLIFSKQYWDSSGKFLTLWCYMASLVFSGQKVHGGGNGEFSLLGRGEFRLSCVCQTQDSRLPCPRGHWLESTPLAGRLSGALAGDLFVGSPGGKRCVVWKSLCIFMGWLANCKQEYLGNELKSKFVWLHPKRPWFRRPWLISRNMHV